MGKTGSLKTGLGAGRTGTGTGTGWGAGMATGTATGLGWGTPMGTATGFGSGTPIGTPTGTGWGFWTTTGTATGCGAGTGTATGTGCGFETKTGNGCLTGTGYGTFTGKMTAKMSKNWVSVSLLKAFKLVSIYYSLRNLHTFQNNSYNEYRGQAYKTLCQTTNFGLAQLKRITDDKMNFTKLIELFYESVKILKGKGRKYLTCTSIFSKNFLFFTWIFSKTSCPLGTLKAQDFLVKAKWNRK